MSSVTETTVMTELQNGDPEVNAREASEFVSLTLNLIGYNSKRTKARIQAINIFSKAFDIQTKRITDQADFEKKIVGSLQEGIGFYLISDADTIQIDHGVICTEPGLTFEGKVTFHMETDGAPHGYCYLKLQNTGNNGAIQRMKHALVERASRTYLSSETYKNMADDIFTYGDGFLSRNVKYLPITGPSTPRTNNFNQVDQIMELCFNILGVCFRFNEVTDVVHALPCIQGTILNKWRTRKRPSGWPDKDMVSKVTALPVYVVPVGWKGAPNEDFQWRISFVEAELYLVQSLNDIQRKLLILAKHIMQNELKPISKHMKSYLVKMAVLWLAEQKPLAEFQEQHLIARLQDVLIALKTSIANQDLPHYMVPERNLLECKLKDNEQQMLISKLDDILDQIRKCILSGTIDRSEKLHTNYTKCVLISIMDKIVTCNTSRQTPEELAMSFINMFKCQSMWGFLFYVCKDNAFPLIYRNLELILKDSIIPCFMEAQIRLFFLDEALSEADGVNQQTPTASVKESKTTKKQLSDSPVKINITEKYKSSPETTEHEEKLLNSRFLNDFSNWFLLGMICILSMPLLTYDDFQSVIHIYLFWFLLSFLDTNYKTKTIQILSLIFMVSNGYNFYTDDGILMDIKQTFFTSKWMTVTCGNETFLIAPTKMNKHVYQNIYILSFDLFFLTVPIDVKDFINHILKVQ